MHTFVAWNIKNDSQPRKSRPRNEKKIWTKITQMADKSFYLVQLNGHCRCCHCLLMMVARQIWLMMDDMYTQTHTLDDIVLLLNVMRSLTSCFVRATVVITIQILYDSIRCFCVCDSLRWRMHSPLIEWTWRNPKRNKKNGLTHTAYTRQWDKTTTHTHPIHSKLFHVYDLRQQICCCSWKMKWWIECRVGVQQRRRRPTMTNTNFCRHCVSFATYWWRPCSRELL